MSLCESALMVEANDRLNEALAALDSAMKNNLKLAAENARLRELNIKLIDGLQDLADEYHSEFCGFFCSKKCVKYSEFLTSLAAAKEL